MKKPLPYSLLCKEIPCTKTPVRGILAKSILSAGILALLAAHGQAQSTWTGLGAPSGTATDINNTGNWSGGTVSGSFVLTSNPGTLYLSDNLSVPHLYFNLNTTGTLNITSNVAGTNRVLSLTSGTIALAHPTGSGSFTTVLSEDITLDFGNFATDRRITLGPGNSKTANLVVNGIVTGTATGTGVINVSSNYVNFTLTNDGNTFDSAFTLGGKLSFTTVNNYGTDTTSSLGKATTQASGQIKLTSSGNLIYIGTTDQSTNRDISISGAGTRTLSNSGAGGSITYTDDVTIAGSGQNTDTFAFSVTDASSKIIMTGTLSDSSPTNYAKISVSGAGVTRFANTNSTYKGMTQISGVLEATKLSDGELASSIGSSSNSGTNLVIGYAGQGTLRYIGTGDSTDRLFTGGTGGAILDASGSGAVNFTNTGAVAFTSGSVAITRTLTLTGTNTGDNTLGALITDGTGAGDVTRLTKTGIGRWIVSNDNTYTGATTISEGELDVMGSLAAQSTVQIGTGAVLGGTGTINGAVSGTSATINGSGLKMGATTFYGTSTLSGTSTASSLTISTGTTSLTGFATSTNNIQVSTGATLVNTGTAASTSGTVAVETTGTLNNNGVVNSSVGVSGVLSGTGSIIGNVTIHDGGLLSPGNSPGTTSITGNLTLETGAQVLMQLDSLTSMDQVIVDGDISLGGGILTLELSDVFLNEASALTSLTTFTLIDASSDTAAAPFSSLSYVTSSGTYSATGNSFSVNDATYTVSYNDGEDGYDVVLSVQAVPEPATWAMLVGSLGALAFGQRLSRRRNA